MNFNWINFVKATPFFQNLISSIVTKVPAFFDHNVAKFIALKKAFFLTALDKIQGDYLEFGVFTGSSFVCAMKSHRSCQKIGNVKTDFYGFDSFKGFGKVADHDRHNFYTDDIFKVNGDKVIKNIYRNGRGLMVKIVKGFFEDTIADKDCRKDFNINKIRCVLIDCDLKGPTWLALNFLKNGLQQGTIIVLDDFFSFGGDTTRGVAGAFFEFCQNNPQLHFRRIFDYGYGGVAYVLSEIKN